ncbi:quinone-dependent dihydroorotate dehydrogenase [Gammaproteobacteria bacterium]|nr:quinone-dependent dihydroorotate dehydrogenase [Gammaproteobacteria bacterium]
MKFIYLVLRIFSPEIAHSIALNSLKLIHSLGLIRLIAKQDIASTPSTIENLTFKNKLGVAAGLDKNGDYIDALGALGFSFIEVGTITPLAQPGNAKPRIFRVFNENAIVNRLGFNNKGVDYLVKKLQTRKYKGIVGVNIGANKDSDGDKRIFDYVECFKKVYEYADYISINISSPNTPNLRDLHNKENIYSLLASINNEKNNFEFTKPIFLKISPDETLETLEVIVGAVEKFDLSGLILSNTTVDKSLLNNKSFVDQAGGLSGEPLFNKSTKLIESIKNMNASIPIIGVGGVISKEHFNQKIDAGADLVQIYTGFILKGPNIISELLD